MSIATQLRAACGALALCASSAAWGAGFYFGENGNKALSQGGAFAAVADDLSAIQHNPAGLTQLRGFHFLLDGALVVHEVTFQRHDAGAATSIAKPVSNTGGPFLAPMAAVGYGFGPKERPITLALGVYGPPSIGRYVFAEPDYNNTGDLSNPVYAQNPVTDAPQRYALIRKDTLIAYPTLSAAWSPLPQLSIGLSLQYVIAHLYSKQAVFSGLSTPRRIREEHATDDSLIAVDLAGNPTVTGILGVLVKPVPQLSFGLSARPPITIYTHGTLDIELGQFATEVGKAQVSENARAGLVITLPWEVKLGAAYRPLPALRVTAELVFQDWSAVSGLTVTPENVTLTLPPQDPKALEAVEQPKALQDSYSVRLGASYHFAFGLDVRAGLLFETSAMPDAYTNIDFLHFTRGFLTAGAGYTFGPLEVVGAFAFTPPSTRDVNDSEVRATSTDRSLAGPIVGNGAYTSGGWVASLGVRGHFGEQ